MDWMGSSCHDVFKLLDFDVGCITQFIMIHGFVVVEEVQPSEGQGKIDLFHSAISVGLTPSV